MITLTNFESGALRIDSDADRSLDLSHDQAHRLIMAARMHSIDPFVEKLSSLIEHEGICREILALFAAAQGSDRWNLKESFSRLQTVTKGYVPQNPESVVESICLGSS